MLAPDPLLTCAVIQKIACLASESEHHLVHHYEVDIKGEAHERPEKDRRLQAVLADNDHVLFDVVRIPPLVICKHHHGALVAEVIPGVHCIFVVVLEYIACEMACSVHVLQLACSFVLADDNHREKLIAAKLAWQELQLRNKLVIAFFACLLLGLISVRYSLLDQACSVISLICHFVAENESVILVMVGQVLISLTAVA